MKQSFAVRSEAEQDRQSLAEFYTRQVRGIDTYELVESLRENQTVWLPEMSLVAITDSGEVMAHALAVRCWIDSFPALVLASVAGEPDAASTVMHALVEIAQQQAADSAAPACLLAHANQDLPPAFFEQYGFEQARFEGIKTTLDVPCSHFLALNLNPDFELAPGTAIFSPEFGAEDDDNF